MADTGVRHLAPNEGPRCRRCKTSEARCAFHNGACCPTCTHWSRFNSDGELMDLRPVYSGRRAS